MYLKFTNLDTDLLLALVEMTSGTTTDLAKLLFNPNNDYDLRKHDNKIRYRLERMRKKDLLKKTNSSYTLNIERVFLTKASMILEDIEVGVSMGMMLVIYPKGDELTMRQISFEDLQKTKKQF